MIRYDLHVRNLLVQKGGTDSEMLDFLFGRPLFKSINAFGVKLEKEGSGQVNRVIIV